jgi:hypothetical protein
MKNIRVVLSAVLVSAGVGVWSGHAQELLSAHIETVSVKTNDTGGLSYRPFGNRQLIEQAAKGVGATNLHPFHVVYNVKADDIEVVSNDVVITTPLSFNDGVSLSKTNERVMERLTWVFVGSSTTANGSLRATEQFHLDTNGVPHLVSLRGRLQFATPATATDDAVIYSGEIEAEHLPPNPPPRPE